MTASSANVEADKSTDFLADDFARVSLGAVADVCAAPFSNAVMGFCADELTLMSFGATVGRVTSAMPVGNADSGSFALDFTGLFFAARVGVCASLFPDTVMGARADDFTRASLVAMVGAVATFPVYRGV